MQTNSVTKYVLKYVDPQEHEERVYVHIRPSEEGLIYSVGYPCKLEQAFLYQAIEHAECRMPFCGGPVRVCSVRLIAEEL